ncbi:MAG: alkaline phosphatase family protein [Actinomycetota bacterium]
MTHVLFLILDAFDPRRLSPHLTPNLWRWANTDGAVAGTGRSVMASCTYPNHATFVTGVGPDVHGIHTNHVIDGSVKGAWEVGPAVPTLFTRLKERVESAAVLGDHHLVTVMGAQEATEHWPPGGELAGVGQLDLLGYPDDNAVLPVLLTALEKGVELVVGYFGSIDTWSHIYGPESEEATDAYRRLDAKIQDIDQIMRGRWEETVLVVVSDHVQDTVAGPGIDLRAELAHDIVVVDEGSAALIGGLEETVILHAIDGVEGWKVLADGNVLVWCEPRRYFGPFDQPVFKGIHGGAHTRTQLALVGGGHRARHELAATVAAGPVPASHWGPAIEGVLNESRLLAP